MHYSKHVYDIDLIAILNTISGSREQIKFYSQDRQKEFFRQTKVAVETALDLDETAVDKLLLSNVPKVFYPSSKNSVYQYWLGLQLTVSNPHSIALILDYHWDNVKHEKWFLEHLEYKVIKSIVSNSFIDTEFQMEKISAWLRENKKQIRNFENVPTVKIKDEVINEVHETLSIYIENLIDKNRFLILLKEGKIQEPIPFGGELKLQAYCRQINNGRDKNGSFFI